MNILFAASGEFAIASLEILLGSGHRILRVYTQPDRPAGRGKQTVPTPLGQKALALGLETVRTENINVEVLPPADLLVVIAFGQKISPAVVNHCRLGSVNLHASLLPRWRGAAPINWAILSGDSVTGNSIIRLAEKMDSGAVLAQASTPIGQTETAGELHDRLAKEGAVLLLETVQKLDRGEAVEQEQDSSKATLAKKLSRGIAAVDFKADAATVSRMIRGLFPWPGCRVQLVDETSRVVTRLTLARAVEAEVEKKGEKPGEIDSHGFVTCGSGAVEILELIPDGKRLMSLEAFKNGHPWTAGHRLEPLS